MKKDIILKYDKDLAIKTGALSSNLYVFLLSIAALLVLISSAVFEFVCYRNGFCELIISKYTSKIIYMSLFIALVWALSISVWFPAYIAETSLFVKKNNKIYRIRNKKDNIFDREKYIENEEFLTKVIEELPKENNNIVFVEYEFCKVIKKNKKYALLQVKNKKGKFKKIKIYNVYSNFENL